MQYGSTNISSSNLLSGGNLKKMCGSALLKRMIVMIIYAPLQHVFFFL